MPKKITVEIMDTGEVKIETTGFKGKSCMLESQWLETILGKAKCRQLTPAYFEKNGQLVKKHLNLCG